MISVIIPAYNCEKTIDRCIKSVLNQTYKDIELIVVNDESTDNTLEVINAIKDDRLKVFSKKNNKSGGAVSAYKFGLKQATGIYIYMIDSDDYIEPDYLGKMLYDIEKFDVDFCCSGHNRFGRGVSLNGLETGKYLTSDINLICKKAYSDILSISTARWDKLFKKKIVDLFIDELNETLVQREDNIFCYLYMRNSKDFYIDNDIVGYTYEFLNTSVAHKYDIDYWYKYKKSVLYLYSLSNNKIESSRLMLDNICEVVNKYIVDGVKYKQLKPIMKDMANNDLVIFAVKEKSLYHSKKEKIYNFLIRKKCMKLFFYLRKTIMRIKGII